MTFKIWLKENKILLILMLSGLILMLTSYPGSIVTKSSLKYQEDTPLELTGSNSFSQPAFKNLTQAPSSEKLEEELTPQSLQFSLQAYQKYFHKCYALALQKRPQTKGQATLRFEVATSGSILNPKVINSTIGAPGFDGCIIDALLRIPFKGHSGNKIQAVVPLVFE